jgi:hypothetical protein
MGLSGRLEFDSSFFWFNRVPWNGRLLNTGISLARVRIWWSDKAVDGVHNTRRGVLLVCCGGHRVAIDTVQASITDPELLEELAFVKPYTRGVLMEVLGSHAYNWNGRGAVVQFW